MVPCLILYPTRRSGIPTILWCHATHPLVLPWLHPCHTRSLFAPSLSTSLLRPSLTSSRLPSSPPPDMPPLLLLCSFISGDPQGQLLFNVQSPPNSVISGLFSLRSRSGWRGDLGVFGHRCHGYEGYEDLL